MWRREVTQGRQRSIEDDIAVVALLRACAKRKDLCKASRLHDFILQRGLLAKNIYIGNTLVILFAKCGALSKAQEVFDMLPIPDVVSWNALISGYVLHHRYENALACFDQMQRDAISPDAVTFISVLKACGSIGAADKGTEVHVEVVKEGLLGGNVLVGTALVDMYVKCGEIEKAREVFDKLRVRDVYSWTTLISGYAQHGQGEEALNCFECMQQKGLSPDAVTFVCVLKACGSIGAAEKGKELHAEIVRARLLDKDVLVGTALVDMYAKCGALDKAQEVFNGLQVRNIVSWNALIAGYAKKGYGKEALFCFEGMQREGLLPNTITYACIFKACGNIQAVDKGTKIHAEIDREGLLEKDILVGTALVDMYTKCGALAKAQEVFDKLCVRDVVTWTVLIAGYAQLGKADTVFDLYNKMIGEGMKPNLVTFTVVLNACSHSGLLEKGQMYFEAMSTDYAIVPTLEHYTCMVDLFGHAGRFDKVVEVIKKMPTSDYIPTWTTLLSACQKWGHVKLGRLAFERSVHLDEKDSGAYVCMGNICAAAAMQEDVDKVEVGLLA